MNKNMLPVNKKYDKSLPLDLFQGERKEIRFPSNTRKNLGKDAVSHGRREWKKRPKELKRWIM